MVDRDEDAARQRAHDLGKNAGVFVADVTDPGAIDAAVEAAKIEFGRLDAVVANAGEPGPSAGFGCL